MLISLKHSQTDHDEIKLLHPSIRIPIYRSSRRRPRATMPKGSLTLVQIPQWTVALPQRYRKFSISVLTHSTAENTDCYGECESALTFVRMTLFRSGFRALPTIPRRTYETV